VYKRQAMIARMIGIGLLARILCRRHGGPEREEKQRNDWEPREARK